MNFIAAILMFLFIAAPLSFYNGVVIADAWNWFIKDYFSLNAISSLQAWGLLMCVGCFRIYNSVSDALKNQTADGRDALKNAFILQLSYAFSLVLSHVCLWFVHTLFF